ncbi:PstS family phosphate ABC transporter substrate-binding protein [Nocardioides sp.]|uniref:PstS family phosphate ABC transporter substrate-binding protein n=1 Tax=Nocardioides sp. TaxID=35761 RepID=UPI00272009CB|nr:phosphate ABC transporter substrate-binding protein PstS [Nocardioides sp.]MDO9454988.1 phosphate ABC transporter substrate-binding protein PstS [Nocardioides sp.]
MLVPGIAVLTVAALSACGASNEDGGSDDPSEGGGAATSAGLTGVLKGAGATSQEKAQEAWTIAVQGANDGFEVQYQPIGSTDGRANFVSGAVAFAGTDSALNDEDGQLTAATETCGGEPIQVPAYVSPIAIAFNLPDIDSVQLSADTVAQIFDGKITNWSEITDEQADGVELPDLDITPVHRSDDSGTTKNFTDYLGKAAPDSWPYEAEDAFPVDGEAADGTSGVIQQITSIEGAIGYADNSQAEGLGKVSVGVGDSFVAPSPEGAAKVLEVSPPAEGVSDVDMAVALDRTTTEDGAYPVVLLSYLVACQSYDDEETTANVKGYLEYIVSDEGQQTAASEAGSAPLGEATAAKAQEIVAKIGG